MARPIIFPDFLAREPTTSTKLRGRSIQCPYSSSILIRATTIIGHDMIWANFSSGYSELDHKMLLALGAAFLTGKTETWAVEYPADGGGGWFVSHHPYRGLDTNTVQQSEMRANEILKCLRHRIFFTGWSFYTVYLICVQIAIPPPFPAFQIDPKPGHFQNGM